MISDHEWSMVVIIILILLLVNAFILFCMALSTFISFDCAKKKKKKSDEPKHKAKFKIGRVVLYWFGFDFFAIMLTLLEFLTFSMLFRDLNLHLRLSKSFELSYMKGG